MKALAVALALSAWAASTAAAGFDRVILEQSRIRFVSTQMNVPVEGTFSRFDAQIRFDPDAPREAYTRIEVMPSAIRTGIEEADQEVQGADWFDSVRHPVATFESTAIEPQEGNRYQVEGRLKIKGRERAVTLLGQFFAAPQPRLEGRLELRRLEWGIGGGIWNDTSVVADPVTIHFSLALGRTK